MLGGSSLDTSVSKVRGSCLSLKVCIDTLYSWQGKLEPTLFELYTTL